MISRKIPIGKNERPKENGHVLDTKQPETQTIIIEHPTDPNVTLLAQHIDLLKTIANSLTPIKSVNAEINDIKALLGQIPKIDAVVPRLGDIATLSGVTDEIRDIFNDLNTLRTIVANLNSMKNVESIKDILEYVYKIREAIERVSSFRTQLLELYGHLDKFKVIYEKLTEILVVHEHLLAIEIVAQNIELLRQFMLNISTLKNIADNKDLYKNLLNNLNTFKRLIDVYNQMELKLNSLSDLYREFTRERLDIQNKINDVKNDLKQADDLIRETQRELEKLKTLIAQVEKLKQDLDKITKEGLINDTTVSDRLTYSSQKIQEIKESLSDKITKLIPDLSKNSERLGGKTPNAFIEWVHADENPTVNTVVKRNNQGTIRGNAIAAHGGGIHAIGGRSVFQGGQVRFEVPNTYEGLYLTVKKDRNTELFLTRDSDGNEDVILTKSRLPSLLPDFTVKTITTENLNTINKNGLYLKEISSSDMLSLNYPENKSGVLFVRTTSTNTSIQEYIVSENMNRYLRTTYNGNFTPWKNVGDGFIKGNLSLGVINLNDLRTQGFYYQGASVDATLDRNYPLETINKGGWLVVQQMGETVVIQEYIPFDTLKSYRRIYNSSGWSQWTNTSLGFKGITTEDLDTIKTNGIYSQGSNANATSERHYPVQKAGSLVVKQTSATTANQEYTVFDTLEVYIRGMDSGNWTSWKLVSVDDSVIKGNLRLNEENLNTIVKQGFYFQGFSNRSTRVNNYPKEGGAGYLRVYMMSGVGVLQEYTTYDTMETYIRTMDSGNWLPWKKVIIDTELTNEDLNTIVIPGTYSKKSFDSDAMRDKNYPGGVTEGVLQVIQGRNLVQLYTSAYNGRQFFRKNLGGPNWGDWRLLYSDWYYCKETSNGAYIKTQEGLMADLAYSDNVSLTITAKGVFGITNAKIGQSGTIIVNNANNITGYGSYLKWQKVPTNLKQKEIFAYFVEDLNIIWMGRLL